MSSSVSIGKAHGLDAFACTTPLFLPEQLFVGRLEGWAVVESLVGGLLKRATIAAHGELDADTVVLTETYTFDDGHSDTLRWTIHKLGEGQYTGHENRLEGGASGEQAGCAFHWTYTRDTPQGDGKSFKLNFDDWFDRRSRLHRSRQRRACGHPVRDGACDVSEALGSGDAGSPAPCAPFFLELNIFESRRG